MKIGDLVKVSNRRFTGIGYICGFGRYAETYVWVRYISGEGYTKVEKGCYPRKKLVLLKEVIACK
jgi:hypothetical protein|tara:strand:+ start:366 stop:560 length:195 start_codon:yes stop_codon:yes gene_type:complete